MNIYKHSRSIKYFLGISIGCGILFTVSTLLCRCMTIEQSLVVGLFGFYIGALALPELEKNFLKNPALYQVIIGALMGLTAPYVFNASLEWFIGGIIIGVLIGYLAPYWLKGVQLPC